MVTTDEVKENITRVDTWQRMFFIVLFAFIYVVASWLLALVVVLQAGWCLVTSTTSTRLRELGAGIGEYLRQIACYGTFNSEEKPFPFAEWPQPGPASHE